jgi:CubicO group peptidase (beta-lactamase class C family)
MKVKAIASCVGCLGLGLFMAHAVAAAEPIASAIDSYVAPYVESNNFSGVLLVKKNEEIIFQKAYGLADRERKIPSSTATRFHIASVSMQFTAAAALRLVDEGTLRLDFTMGEILPETRGAEKITVRDLLTERSGLPDINELPEYDAILQTSQTPAALVAKIRGRPLLFEPGSQFLHEEHSAYNLLALLVEEKTKLSFAAALQRLVFQPMHLDHSFVDDDVQAAMENVARGYAPAGVFDLEPAREIHWSAKTGNASICTTAGDESRWVDALWQGCALTESSRNAMLDTAQRVGYGWFKGASKRFDATAYYMNGRAPGFASFVLYLPREKLTVIVFSNVYSSVTSEIGNDVACIVLGRDHGSFQPGKPLSSAVLKGCTGWFQFGPDFFQKNARVRLEATGSDLFLRWPSGEQSPLIPLGPDHFLDRNYWESVLIERNPSGRPERLIYDRFRGSFVEEVGGNG